MRHYATCCNKTSIVMIIICLTQTPSFSFVTFTKATELPDVDAAALCQSWHRAWHFSTVPSTGEAQWGGKSQQWEHYTTIRHDAAKVVTPKASFLQPRHFVWQGLKLQSHQR